MKTSVEELSSVQRRLTVELPAAQVDQTLDKLYKRLQRTAKLKGFRPGKVPRTVLERYYGPQMAAEAAEALISETYPQALQEHSLEPVAEPSLDQDALPAQGQDFVFKLTLDVRPEFELKQEDYQGLKLKEPRLEVTDEVIEAQLGTLQERQALLVPVEEDRFAVNGDVVVVDYQSFDQDQPVEGGAADNLDVELGAGQVQPEIEKVLQGTKPGDMVKAVVQYGLEAANSAVAGKEIEFKLLVKGIKQKVLPELDDEFAVSLGPEFNSLDELKERIRKELEQNHQEQRDVTLRNQILDQVGNLVQFDLPTSLVEREAGQMVESFKARLQQSGLDPTAANLDDAKLLEDFRPQAERKVKAGIVLGRISDLEEVEVSQADMDQEFERLAERTGQPATVIKEIYNKNNGIPSLRAHLLEEKTLQAVKAGAIIELVDPAELAKETEEEKLSVENES